jgi:hypothetical protein
VFSHLETRGASFLADVARAVHRLPGEVENALWELVASGLVTGDGIAGLRTLLLPESSVFRKAHLRALPTTACGGPADRALVAAAGDPRGARAGEAIEAAARGFRAHGVVSAR